MDSILSYRITIIQTDRPKFNSGSSFYIMDHIAARWILGKITAHCKHEDDHTPAHLIVSLKYCLVRSRLLSWLWKIAEQLWCWILNARWTEARVPLHWYHLDVFATPIVGGERSTLVIWVSSIFKLLDMMQMVWLMFDGVLRRRSPSYDDSRTDKNLDIGWNISPICMSRLWRYTELRLPHG